MAFTLFSNSEDFYDTITVYNSFLMMTVVECIDKRNT